MGAPVFPGGPASPTYNSLTNPGIYQGMSPSLQLQGNQDSLIHLRNQALGNSSPWTQMQLGNLPQQNMWARSNAASDAARANFASRGKYGNAEMGAVNGANNSYGAQNAADQATQAQKLALIQKDMSDKGTMIRNQVGNEVQATLPQQYNINNALNDKAGNDLANFTNWNEQMKAWGATKQSNAIANSGGGGKK